MLFFLFQELVTPEHLCLSKDERPLSVVCSYVGTELKHIGESAADKIVKTIEPVRWAWKNRLSDTCVA